MRLQDFDPDMFELNCIQAQKISESECCTQHVNAQVWRGSVIGYSVSDWYDSDATLVSYANGIELG